MLPLLTLAVLNYTGANWFLYLVWILLMGVRFIRWLTDPKKESTGIYASTVDRMWSDLSR